MKYPTTSKTLLGKLHEGDAISWHEFYNRYKNIVFSAGKCKGLSDAEFTTQMMRVLVVSRGKQDFPEHCPEAKSQAVYLIVGEDENCDPKVYIGQTRRMTLRIKPSPAFVSMSTRAFDLYAESIV